MKILIKGAGDLASGIACRLYACGFSIIMTDIEIPTTVRRTVAFSRAIYEGSAQVEGITAVRCGGFAQAQEALALGQIAVLADPVAAVCREYKPDVVIDAILAKKNLGTSMEDAPVVIGVGPGFTAGEDCSCVVETQRGHDLGRCIYQGSAAPNTGVPGLIEGFGAERLLRAPAEGAFQPAVTIGTRVKAGEICGYAGGVPMKSSIDGVVRGLLQPGVWVHPGMKAGDVDPRGKAEYCFTVSDKARAVGGGVLEAILHLCEK